MVNNPAFRIDSAQAGTGIHTPQLLACLVARTLRIDRAFRSARHVGVAEILGDARAGGGSVSVRAHRVLTARRGVAGVRRCRDNGTG